MKDQDKIVLHKTSHIHHVLTLYRDGKIVFRKQLSTKDFFKHDLIHIGMHYYIFWDIFHPEEEEMDLEFLAGALHNITDPEFDAPTYIKNLKVYYKDSKKKLPKFVEPEFLKVLRTFVIRYLSEYKVVKTGKSLEIIFKK